MTIQPGSGSAEAASSRAVAQWPSPMTRTTPRLNTQGPPSTISAQATGSAVVGDIVDLARRVHGGKATQVPPMGFQQGERRPLVIRPMARIESLYYLHLRVVDRPGVLADIAGVFGRHRISIARVIQDSQASGKTVSLVVMTHRAVEQSVQDALQEIEKLDCVADPATLIRVEAEDV